MSDTDSSAELVFEVITPLGFSVRTTVSYWSIITTIKHPAMAGREADVQEVLRNPAEVRQSKVDGSVYLFYRNEHEGRWLCAVARRLNGEGFLITSYPTDRIKEGNHIWPT